MGREDQMKGVRVWVRLPHVKKVGSSNQYQTDKFGETLLQSEGGTTRKAITTS